MHLTISGLQKAVFLLELVAVALVTRLAHVHWGWPYLLALPVVALLPPLAHGLVIASGFGLAQCALVLTGHRRPLHQRVAWHKALRCYLREWMSSLQNFSWNQPWRAFVPMAGETRSGPGVPILFIHGYLCNRAMWRSFAKAADTAGHPVAAVNLEPVFGQMGDFGPVIDVAVRALCTRCDANQVVLVCHSMGGLAARAYLRTFGAERIRAVVTLGTPHAGTALAITGLGENARQMRLSSPWREELVAQETAEIRALFIAIHTHHDNIVAPHTLQWLDGAQNIELSGIGHMTLAYDKQVQRMVLDLITALPKREN